MKIKKLLSIISLCIVVTLVLANFTGCTDKAKSGELTIGLIQLVDHTSLNEIKESFEKEVKSLADKEGIKININYKNAQGDQSQINSICRNFVEDKVDVIVAIATPAAQGAASATKDIPIVFSAVTDPVDAKIIKNNEKPDGNVTGVSDAIDVEKIFALAEELTPGIKTFGILYNSAEPNSVSVVNDAKAYLTGKGITVNEKTVTTTNEIQQASRTLFETCDAVFSPIDNTVAGAMSIVTTESKAAKKPMYVSADSMVKDGGLATVGVNYTVLGQKTAAMTIKVLKGTAVADIPVEVITEVLPFVNKDTAAAIGVDVSKYAN